MNEERIIKMYENGASIDYIAKEYYRYKNKNKKPIKVNNVVLYPTNIWTKSDCRLYVVEIIYKYLVHVS